MQHAPRGAQASAVHVVPLPLYVPPAVVHASAVKTEQEMLLSVGLAAQHAPVGMGRGQVALVHAEPSPL